MTQLRHAVKAADVRNTLNKLLPLLQAVAGVDRRTQSDVIRIAFEVANFLRARQAVMTAIRPQKGSHLARHAVEPAKISTPGA